MLSRSFVAIVAAGAISVAASGVQNRKSGHPPPPGLEDYGHVVKPKNGFVPDETTAIRIAEAVLMPIYGETEIQSERPFKATLKDGIWTVTGTLPPQFLGGTAVVRLSKADGRILLVAHEA